tara:strand:+ start:1085 stop:2152 length:1068 start_codon:yes stop_codon:yes gene_type:complete
MAQHDYDIANQSFPAFRTDLNNVLGAINSSNSGTSRPSSATTGTIWLDTTNSGSNSLSLKFFDGAQDIELATVDTSANTVNFLDSVTGGVADNSVTLAKLASGTDGNIISFDASGDPVAVATGSAGQVLTSAGAGAPPTFATATVPDDAITLAKMASGTDGNIISYDTSGNPVAVATGSSGQVLTSAGAGAVPSFQSPAGGGKLLQVVSTTKTDVFTSNTNSFVDITGLSVSITPSASNSKIMVICNILIGGQNGSLYAYKLLRGSTDISIGDSAGSRTRASLFGQHTGSSYINVSNSITFLDSPNTTSSTTYKIQGRAETTGGQLISVNAHENDGNSANVGRGASTITVMEIGA